MNGKKFNKVVTVCTVQTFLCLKLTHSLTVKVMFITIISHLFLFVCCFFLSFMFSRFFRGNTGYKPYMYISPITERMRKRKAFADTELEGNAHLFAASSLPSSSSVSNLTPSSYSCLSMLTLPQNGHLSNIIDYHTLRQRAAMESENTNATEYLPTAPPPPQPPLGATINDYQLSELLRSKSPSSSMSLSPPPQLLSSSSSLPSLSPQHKIRIIDDAKLMYMRRQINEPSLIYNPLTAEHSSECTAKPKLSFSIESIIGIK